jgi:cation transporter-like permease
MVLMGKLSTSPKQAHLIFFLFSTLCSTPMMLTVITTKVIVFVRMGLNPVKKAIPKASSVKTYT